MSETENHLDVDTFLPHGQKFVCLSFLVPKDNKDSTLTGLKVRGVFSDYEKACEHAKLVQSLDKYHNVYVGEMGKWLPFDPDPESKTSGDSEYGNEELNKMMKNYKKNQENAKLMHQHRKYETMSKNMDDNIKIKDDDINKLKDSNEDPEYLDNKLKNMELELKKMEEKKKEYDDLEKEFASKIKNNEDNKLEDIVEDSGENEDKSEDKSENKNIEV